MAVAAPARDVETRSPASWRGPLQRAVLAIPIVLFAGAAWAHRQIVDDGFIYLRIVSQIRAGNGPVFNNGERVEAFTGPLWVGLLSVADLLAPIRLEWLAVGIGLALSLLGVGLAMLGARRLAAPYVEDGFYLPFGILALLAILPMWIFATSGLETGLTFAWLGASIWILARWAEPPGRSLSLAHAFVLGLGWLVRPELVLVSLASVALVLAGQWRRAGVRAQLPLFVAAFALPLVYQVFRMVFYGSVVANTAIVKEGTTANWSRGWEYLRDFADPYWLWVPALVLLLGGYVPLVTAFRGATRRRALGVVAVFAGVGLASGLYVVAVGGDYIHARLFLPAVFALCAPIAVVPATRRNLLALVLAPWLVLAIVALRPDQGLGVVPGAAVVPGNYGKVTVADNGWDPGGPRASWYEGPAFYYQGGAFATGIVPVDVALRSSVALPTGAISGVGLVSYAMGTDFHVIDTLGLADPLTAHLRTTPSMGLLPRRAGHEKPLPQVWLLARITPAGSSPAADTFPPLNNPLIPPTSGREFREQLAWARAALQCTEIREMLRAANSDLTLGRAWHNLVDSFDNARLRIPPDPEAAYHEFCGTETPPEVLGVRAGG